MYDLMDVSWTLNKFLRVQNEKDFDQLNSIDVQKTKKKCIQVRTSKYHKCLSKYHKFLRHLVHLKSFERVLNMRKYFYIIRKRCLYIINQSIVYSGTLNILRILKRDFCVIWGNIVRTTQRLCFDARLFHPVHNLNVKDVRWSLRQH